MLFNSDKIEIILNVEEILKRPVLYLQKLQRDIMHIKFF
jgi:hypothetical protein